MRCEPDATTDRNKPRRPAPFGFGIALAIAVATAGCAEQTSIVVLVSAPNLAIPQDVDALHFEVESEKGRRVDRIFDLVGSWPQSLTVLPSAGEDGRFTIAVTALTRGAFVVRRVVHAEFEAGVSRTVAVILSSDCVGVMCAQGLDCVAGRCCVGPDCTAVGIESGDLDGGDRGRDAGPSRNGERDSGPSIDGGAVLDAGVLDAAYGRDSGAALDARTVDVDAGTLPIRCVGGASAGVCRGLLVIAEAAIHGPGGASDEFIEIYNRSTVFVDATGVGLAYAATATSIPMDRAILPAGTVLPPGGYYLVGSAGYRRATVPDLPSAWSPSQGFSSARGGLVLHAGTETLDVVGWFREGVAPPSEGIPIAGPTDTDLASGVSFERKARTTSTAASMGAGGADERAGNGMDTDDNATDFVRRTMADPQSSASPLERP